MPSNSYVFIIMLCLLSSCITELEPENLAVEQRLVIKSEFDANDNRPLIHISTNFSDNQDVLSLGRDISVSMYENGDTRAKPFEQTTDQGQQWKSVDPIEFQHGILYFLNIDATSYGLPPILAETVVPFPGDQSIETVNVSADQSLINTSIVFTKPPGIKHYYHLDLYVQDSLGMKTSLKLDRIEEGSNAVHVLESISGMLIDFSLLPNDKFLSFSVVFDAIEDISSLKSDYLYFNLKTITQDYYLYYISLDSHIEAVANPFSLPEITFSNISNGYGLFTAYSTTLDSVRIR